MAPKLGFLSPYLGTIAAAAIFLSWTVSTTLEERARRGADKAAQIANQIRESSFRTQVIRRLTTIEGSVFRMAHPSQNPSHLSDIRVNEFHDRADPMAAYSYLWRSDLMISIAEDLNESDALRSRMETSAKNLRVAASRYIDNYLAAIKLIPPLNQSKDAIETKVIAEKLKAHSYNLSDELVTLNITNDVAVDVLEDAIEEMGRRSNRQSLVASRSKLAAYIIFAIGTSLALCGKVIEERKARRLTTSTADAI